MIKLFNNKKIENDEVVYNVEPKMLPTKFRERANNFQKIALFLILFIYAIAVGVISFTLLAGLSSKMLDIFAGEADYIILTMVLSIALLFVGGISTFWTKKRSFLFSWTETAIFLIGPLIYIVAYSYLSFNFNFEKPIELFLFIGIVSASVVILPLILNTLRIIIIQKRFKHLLKKIMLITPGLIVLSLVNLVLWFIESQKMQLEITNTIVIAVVITLGLGTLLTIVGIMFSYKVDDSSANVWSNIRFSGSLTTLIAYATLMTISLRFATFHFSTPVIISLLMNLFYLGLLALYLYFRSWMKNVSKTNPIWNHVTIKLFIIFNLLTAFLLITTMDQLAFLKSFGPSSFTIVFMTSFNIVIGSFLAHISKLITYSKFFKTIIAGSFGALILILFTIFSIIILKDSEIILAIIARQINILFLLFALVLEVTALLINLFYVLISILWKNRTEAAKNQSNAKTKKRKFAYKGVK